MWKRSERTKADVQEWSDVAVWLSDVMDSVDPDGDTEDVTRFPIPVSQT